MYHFPWTDSEAFINVRINEELLKYGQGDLKVSFSLPINWIDLFDIFSNFRLQEPFGLDGSTTKSPAERGEAGRYYYIASLTYDFMNQKIDIVGIDLQFIIRQCMIVADCDDVGPGEMADKWKNASELDKIYAYVGNCDAGAFVSDGAPLKRVCPCSVCE